MNLLHLARVEREFIIIIKYVKYLLAYDFNQILICLTDFRNNPQHKFHENPPGRAELFNTETDRQTDGWTERQSSTQI